MDLEHDKLRALERIATALERILAVLLELSGGGQEMALTERYGRFKIVASEKEKRTR